MTILRWIFNLGAIAGGLLSVNALWSGTPTTLDKIALTGGIIIFSFLCLRDALQGKW